MDPWMADRMADPDSWQDMVDDWMGEPAGVLCEVDDNLRALDAHADPASFGGGDLLELNWLAPTFCGVLERESAAEAARSGAAGARDPQKVPAHDPPDWSSSSFCMLRSDVDRSA